MGEPSHSTSAAHGLWDAFVGSNDARARAALIEHYMPFARMIAARVYGLRVEPAPSFDDFLQYARVGLIEAIDRFDRGRGVSFEAYAVHRVRGAVLNGIEQESERAAQREFRRAVAAERMQSLIARTGRPADAASLQDFIEITVGLAVGIALESVPEEPVDETPGGNPYAAVELAQFVRQVRQLVAGLPEREREVIQGHYYERLEFQEVARRTGVTKGRVSQLHSQALARLRQWLAEQPRLNRRL